MSKEWYEESPKEFADGFSEQVEVHQDSPLLARETAIGDRMIRFTSGLIVLTISRYEQGNGLLVMQGGTAATLNQEQARALQQWLNEQLSASEQQIDVTRLPKQARSDADYRAWLSFVDSAPVDALLAALHERETYTDLIGNLLADRLRERGYTIVAGKEPRDAVIERTEGTK